jgi:hypothetical protein
VYQKLLERYPILIPGMGIDSILPVGHNGIFPQGVITQPILPGLAAKRPDFCVMSYDSATLYATFIEIESPCKRWATRSGQSTAQLTQALQQLRDWSIWFSDPLNSARFLQDYHIPSDINSGRDFAQHYVLIYGRRQELWAARFGKKRNRLQKPNEMIMTWDRIQPHSYPCDLFTLRIGPNGYHVVRVPPTLTLGPHSARDHALLLDRTQAIDDSIDIPEERRAFIKERWSYWDEWSKRSHKRREREFHILSFGDVE